MRLLVAPPELNMEMDSYRVGSMLELVRKVSASRLVALSPLPTGPRLLCLVRRLAGLARPRGVRLTHPRVRAGLDGRGEHARTGAFSEGPRRRPVGSMGEGVLAYLGQSRLISADLG